MRTLSRALFVLGSLAACGGDHPEFLDGNVGGGGDAAASADASVDAAIDAPVDAMVDRTPATFFGNGPADQNAKGLFPPTGSDAAAQRAAFMARLARSATETFEAAPLGVPPEAAMVTTLPVLATWGGGGHRLTQDVTGLASFNAGSITSTDTSGSGRFNTTPGAGGAVGDGQWWEAASPFTLQLAAPAHAIGFYVTDFGDFGSALRVDLFLGAASVGTLMVPPVQGSSGNLAFFGRVDPAISFDRVVLALTQPVDAPQDSYDHVGFDDVVVGLVE
jgi:hypothetical protein